MLPLGTNLCEINKQETAPFLYLVEQTTPQAGIGVHWRRISATDLHRPRTKPVMREGEKHRFVGSMENLGCAQLAKT
jgi:hypothetical protein